MILTGVAAYFAVAALFVESLVWTASRPSSEPDWGWNHETDLPPEGFDRPASPLNAALRLK